MTIHALVNRRVKLLAAIFLMVILLIGLTSSVARNSDALYLAMGLPPIVLLYCSDPESSPGKVVYLNRRHGVPTTCISHPHLSAPVSSSSVLTVVTVVL